MFGICAETVSAAGGIWVQTYGRCCYARLDAATDITYAASIKPKQSVQYAVEDHDDTPTASSIGFFERARHGSGGATKWGGTTWETVADFPWYDVAMTLAVGAQGNTTYGDPCAQVFLTGNTATIA